MMQVGRAREDVVGAEQVELLLLAALLAQQPLDGGQDLLVRRGPGVDDVLGALVALVLHRVEEQAVVLLEDRQHVLAADRGPAAEDRRDLVLEEQLLGLFGEDVGELRLADLRRSASICLPSTPPALR